MENKQKIPQVRFKGFTDAWEQRELKELASFAKGSGYSKNDIKEQGTPLILYGRLYTKYETKIYEVDTFAEPQKGSIYSKGCEVIVPASGETSEDIARASYVAKSGILLGGDLNIIYPNDTIEPTFLALSISNGEQQKNLAKKAQGKSVVHLHNSDLETVNIVYPTRTEQARIGQYFDHLDTLITLHQRKCDTLQKLKKSMLQKMFPKNDSLYPEIRFEGFTDAWEQRKLGEVFTEYSEKNHEELSPLTIIQGKGTILREESNRNLIYDKAGLKNYKLVNEGDFILHLRSFEGGLEMANSRGIVSPAYHIFHGENADSRFYYPFFRSKYFISVLLKPYVYGIRDGKSIDVEGMKLIRIPCPKIEEQQLIGDYFETLDTLITLHQRKLETLKKLKKSMLQKMFI